MANTPSYWTLKRKSRERVNQQLESIQSGFALGCRAENVPVDNYEYPVNNEEDFMDCESSFPEELDSLQSDNSISGEEEEAHMESRLASWALQQNITHSALSNLFKILKYHHPSLPADARTLLGTSRSESVVVQEKAGGTYHYFGILKSIKTTVEANKSSLTSGVCLELQANVDGLPVFKSSSTQFWPILGVIKNLPQHQPFVIGLFCGTRKPSLIEYLEDFVGELLPWRKVLHLKELP